MHEITNKKRLATEDVLGISDVETLLRRIMDLALRRTGARSGGIFLWDDARKGLALRYLAEEGLFINLPEKLIRPRGDGRPDGIPLLVYSRKAPYLCPDGLSDPHHSPYFKERSIAAVPISAKGHVIGVLSTFDLRPRIFDDSHLKALKKVTEISEEFLRRARAHFASPVQEEALLFIRGLSPQWTRVEKQLEQAAPTDAPILLQGEAGTGKERVARVIHANSRRAEGPFVSLNCDSLSSSDLEDDRLALAAGGSLFLDEVGALSPDVQAKLIHKLEAPEHSDLRLLCASRLDLPAMLQEGTFREDLYYRISLLPLRLPPLRAYKDKLPTLARVFMERAAAKHHNEVDGLSPEALSLLSAHDFPGNLRELQACMAHAVILCDGREIQAEHLPESLHTKQVEGSTPNAASGPPCLQELREQTLAPVERRYLCDLLDHCDGDVRAAAELAGVNHVTLYRLLRKRGLQLSRRARPKKENAN